MASCAIVRTSRVIHLPGRGRRHCPRRVELPSPSLHQRAMNLLRVGIILLESFSVSLLAEFLDRLRSSDCLHVTDASYAGVDCKIMATDRRRIVSGCGVLISPDTDLLD